MDPFGVIMQGRHSGVSTFCNETIKILPNVVQNKYSGDNNSIRVIIIHYRVI